jgi:hypothetical protein
MIEKPKSRSGAVLKELRHQHPRDSRKRLAQRFTKLLKEDEALREDVVNTVFNDVCDELYDEYAREGRSIRAGLRKPS